MSRTDLWSYVAHLEVGLSLMLGIPALAVAILVPYRKWRSRLRTTATADPGPQQRRSRRGHRRPLTQPSSVRGADMPEKLAKSTGCFGRVPIEHYRHRRRLVAFWRAARLNLLPRRTRGQVSIHRPRLAIRAHLLHSVGCHASLQRRRRAEVARP